MRLKLLLCTLFALALPVFAGASTRATGDGTLTVTNADGFVRIQARGGVIGRCDSCSFVLQDLSEADLIVPVVSGAEQRVDTDNDGVSEVYSGTNIRFRQVGGAFLLRITKGKDVDLSAVGKGFVRIRGTAGTYSVNDGPDEKVPAELKQFSLSASSTG
jgi:hypothetical protein